MTSPTDPAAAEQAEGLPADLLPRLARLSSVLNRGEVFEHARTQAGLAVERPALSVLATLQMAGRPLRIGEIAERMQVVGPHITRLVAGLEQRGLLQRITDPTDQRARLIEPTAQGRAATERYMGAVLSLFTRAMADWSAHDRAELGRLLTRLVDDVTAGTDELTPPSS